MKKIKENGIRNIVHTNICIIIMILVVLILTIVYKFITYKNEIQAPLETSVNLEELYNTTKTEEADINEEENKKDVNSNISDWELLLVNKNHKIPDDYIVALEEIETTHKVDKRIASSLEEMLNEARKQGLSPIICSSYRTNAKQKQLYNDKIKEYRRLGYNRTKAEELASYWIAIPGTGEHETGLAVDIVSKDYQILDEKQEETDVQKWLMENSYKYGFALRYPTDKKEITMINYEPWHYRYVGIENATYMKEHGMCLEEYIDYLKQFEEEKYKELV